MHRAFSVVLHADVHAVLRSVVGHAIGNTGRLVHDERIGFAGIILVEDESLELFHHLRHAIAAALGIREALVIIGQLDVGLFSGGTFVVNP